MASIKSLTACIALTKEFGGIGSRGNGNGEELRETERANMRSVTVLEEGGCKIPSRHGDDESSATAVSKALSMILRLQREKSAVMMEAKRSGNFCSGSKFRFISANFKAWVVMIWVTVNEVNDQSLDLRKNSGKSDVGGDIESYWKQIRIIQKVRRE
ncbi:hypothetical protein Q3G72_000291 [Acer saccharum]|nr:hypothetical protein Q3G72_000291 [Acer saccharum]